MDNINNHLQKPHRKYMGDIKHRYLSLCIREYVGKAIPYQSGFIREAKQKPK